MFGGNARRGIGRSIVAAEINHAKRPGECCLSTLDKVFLLYSQGFLV
jgi:hypothetical protein